MDKVPALANEDEETENVQYNLRFAKNFAYLTVLRMFHAHQVARARAHVKLSNVSKILPLVAA